MSGIRIHAGQMIPEVLGRYPQVRPVFDRYGLKGCGGPLGPAETIDYFARAHGVSIDQLITEMNQALDNPPPEESASASDPADAIYRRFFKAGIAVVLTVGAAWGAYLLLRIGLAGKFTGISIHDINAHGHAQIFGWVGLFVMGFAYQAFPRFKHTTLWRPRLAIATFFLMLIGLVTRAVCEPLYQVAALRYLGLLGGACEVAGVAMFVVIILKTIGQSGKPWDLSDRYIAAALVFFLIQSIYSVGLYLATTGAETVDGLLAVVGTFQAPLRDLQIHGFAMLMILGVSLRILPALFGFRAPGKRLASVVWYMLVIGIVAEAATFILMRTSGDHRWGLALYAAVLTVAGGTMVLTLWWGWLAEPTESDRSIKFVKGAYAWLHVSMIMLLLVPVYVYWIVPTFAPGSEAAQIGFSHAYYGAARHAITVGFISLMILGVAAKVVPTLNGVDSRRLRPLWTPFLLIYAGCTLRVLLQIWTDFQPWAFRVVPISGVLEVAGIAIWGVHLWRIMAGRACYLGTRQDRPERIAADHMVADVLKWYPQTLEVFLAHGLKAVGNPVMRKTVARTVSVRVACRHHSLDVDQLVAALNAAAGLASTPDADATAKNQTGLGLSLPILETHTE